MPCVMLASRVSGMNNDSSPECEGSERSWSPSTVHENYATGRGRSADLFLLSESDVVKRVRHEEIVKVVLDRFSLHRPGTAPGAHTRSAPSSSVLTNAAQVGACARLKTGRV